MAVRSYSQEVWNRLKEVYENSPKMSWQKLVDLVGEELGCDMPSPLVVRKRALKEKWKKLPKYLVKKTARELNKEIKKITNDSKGKNESECDSQADEKIEKNDDEPDGKEQVKKSQNLVNFTGKKTGNHTHNDYVQANTLTAAKIIKLNRARLADLGQLAGDTISSVIHIRDEVLELDINNLVNHPEYESIINGLKFKMGLISQIVDLNTKQSITLSNIAKSEALFWGFELEELKDQSEQQARRTSTIIDAEQKLAKAKEEMKKQKRLAFERKLEMIEAGEDEHTEDNEELTQ